MDAISINCLCKTYRSYAKPTDRLKQALSSGSQCYYQEFPALNNVSFSIARGETVGIIGRNGSGKSTLLQIICSTLCPTAGDVLVKGRISALLELGAGFNPEFTGKENIYLNASILGLSKEQTDACYEAIIAFSGLSDVHVNQPVKTYSSGMYIRLAFSVAVAVDPDILIIDEALAVGDEAFQRKCFTRIRDLQARGTTILFVSHASSAIVELCDRALWLDAGELLYDGSPKLAIDCYHKLIYSPFEKQEALKTAVHEQGIECLLAHHNHGDFSVAQAIKQSAVYDPGLVPETCNIYPSKGAFISDPHITNQQGDRVNLLTTGETYCYCYSVAFQEEAEHVRFGMFIKTKSGLELAGAGTSTLDNTIAYIPKGANYEISMQFTCHLREGLYYINCGCFARDGDDWTFLHRIIDACAFRVLPDHQGHIGGMVDMQIVPVAKQL